MPDRRHRDTASRQLVDEARRSCALRLRVEVGEDAVEDQMRQRADVLEADG
jgi:hypothetical protein